MPDVIFDAQGNATLPDGATISRAHGDVYLAALAARGQLLRAPDKPGDALSFFGACGAALGALQAGHFEQALDQIPTLLNALVHGVGLSGAGDYEELPGFSYEDAGEAGTALAEVLARNDAARDFNRISGRVDVDKLRRQARLAGLAFRWVQICEDASAYGRRALVEPAREIGEAISRCVKFLMPISSDDLVLTDRARRTIGYYYERFEKARDSRRMKQRAQEDANANAERRVAAARAEGRDSARAELTETLARILGEKK